jgi:hypothetical protein
MAGEWHGNGMASVNQTRPHCVNQMGKTQSKALAERHGRGQAWCVELDFKTRSAVSVELASHIAEQAAATGVFGAWYFTLLQ